jgi:hypothetical protein
MDKVVKRAALPLCAAVALLVSAPAMAQTRSGGASWLPYTTNGYVGLNVGKPDYKLGCTAGFSCDDPNASFHVYTGGSFNDWLGVEAGYLYMGKADRQGGTTRGHGINLSVVGTVPVSQSVKLFGKLGTTYGRTTISANALSGEITGDESGFGAAYALGASLDVNPATAVLLEWDRHEMKFAGRGREPIEALSVGVKFRF